MNIRNKLFAWKMHKISEILHNKSFFLDNKFNYFVIFIIKIHFIILLLNWKCCGWISHTTDIAVIIIIDRNFENQYNITTEQWYIDKVQCIKSYFKYEVLWHDNCIHLVIRMNVYLINFLLMRMLRYAFIYIGVQFKIYFRIACQHATFTLNVMDVYIYKYLSIASL